MMTSPLEFRVLLMHLVDAVCLERSCELEIDPHGSTVEALNVVRDATFRRRAAVDAWMHRYDTVTP